MPCYPCKVPSCTNYVRRPARFCDGHAEEARRDADERAKRRAQDPHAAARDRHYNQHLRNPAARAFYNSTRWKLARAAYLAAHPTCERCAQAWAAHVHHKKPLRECTEQEKTAPDNLRALCPPCHNIEETELEKETACATSK